MMWITFLKSGFKVYNRHPLCTNIHRPNKHNNTFFAPFIPPNDPHCKPL